MPRAISSTLGRRRELSRKGQGHLGESSLIGIPVQLPADGLRQGGGIPLLLLLVQTEDGQILERKRHLPVEDRGAGHLHGVSARPNHGGPDGLRPPTSV